MRATIPSKPTGREAVLYVRLYKFVDILIPTYFQINLAFICFILQLQISLTVLQYLNHYEAS